MAAVRHYYLTGPLLLLSLLMACDRRDPVAPAVAVTDLHELLPAAAILDGGHDGNPHFFFLPPLVSASAYSGTFDGSLLAHIVIDVCEWTVGECGSSVAHFTAKSEGSERVRIGRDDGEHYHVDWQTHRLNLVPGTIYRIRVLVSGIELGHRDVSFFTQGAGERRTRRGLRNPAAGPELEFQLGRTVPIRFRIERGAGTTGTIGPAGGILGFFTAGVVLEIPPGAVTEATTITVHQLPSDLDHVFDDRAYASHVKRVLGGFVAKPDGLVFDVPIVAHVPLAPRGSPIGIPFLAEVDLDAGQYFLLPTNLTYLPDDDIAEVMIESFSTKTIVELTPGLSADDPCRAGRIQVMTAELDFSGGPEGECQIVSEFFEITFLDCPGSPTERGLVSETTPQCSDDFCLLVEVTPDNVPLTVGQEVTLSAAVRDEETGAQLQIPVFWTGDAPDVATVNAVTGSVRALMPGSAVIRACSPDPDFCGEATVTVLPAAAGAIRGRIWVDANENNTFEQGIDQPLTNHLVGLAGVEEKETRTDLVGRYAFEGLARGDYSVFIALLPVGVAWNRIVTAVQLQDGAQREANFVGRRVGSVDIAVLDTITFELMQVTGSSLPLEVRETAQLFGIVRDEQGRPISGIPITWSSGDEDVATVDPNAVAGLSVSAFPDLSRTLISGLASGRTRIFAEVAEVTGFVDIVVRPLVFAGLVSLGGEVSSGGGCFINDIWDLALSFEVYKHDEALASITAGSLIRVFGGITGCTQGFLFPEVTPQSQNVILEESNISVEFPLLVGNPDLDRMGFVTGTLNFGSFDGTFTIDYGEFTFDTNFSLSR